MPNYLALQATSGYHVSTPHTAAMNPGTNTVDMRVKVAMDDWAPAVNNQYLICCYWEGDTTKSQYLFYLPAAVSGNLWSVWYAATGGTSQFATAGAAPGVTNGGVKWVRTLFTPSAGTASYYKSDDGSSWTQVGTTWTGMDTSGIQVPGVLPSLRVAEADGASTGGWTGKVYRAILIVNSVTICDIDFSLQAAGANNTTFTATTGETWTISGLAIIAEDLAAPRQQMVPFTRGAGDGGRI